ncbi:DUF1028 domain-containing protein [Aquimarina sp. U1-2]|uniref:DUF1028 domain-containing protein n=1 Tax=Aquimarina sp. U1-2 TaxID=2823141 RepID=UPI001AEC80FA|nr:DUF1028 domain-containing protein [Aquimarina sp. U1-2]MBP2833059.1 DUF1028 domain-containing protein [Aquimarina sp. U1-2]
MKIYKKVTLFALLWLPILASAQNLPSLLTDKNINSTFSIIAYDENAKEWGIAVATDNIYVGNSTIYIEPNIGAFSVIAETEPNYALEGFKYLREGKTIEESINQVKQNDPESNYRQVSGIDSNGNVFAFTGESLKYWNGNASHKIGKHYVVMGNQLDDKVLDKMAITFENSKGTLAQRLLKSIVAGQEAGGQITGKQSGALVVKGTDNEWYNQIDLRVDNSKRPFEELQTLMNYHYGRIRLNQARYAFEGGNSEIAIQKLVEAESMLDGWTGIYSKIAMTNILIGKKDKAIDWIKKGIDENSNWKVNLPAFYFMKENQELNNLIKPETFTPKDWENAIAMLISVGRNTEAIELCNDLAKKDITTTYLNYLIGKAHYKNGNLKKATTNLEKAIEMDENNVEAKNLLAKIKSK